jgi:uncharacterized membrane protein
MTKLSPALIRLHWPLFLMAAIVASGLLWPIEGGWMARLGWGWIGGVAFFLAESGAKLMRGHTTAQIRRRAADLDDAGAAVLPLALLAAVASVGVVIHEAARPDGVHPALALLTVALSWTFVHVIFAFHYAHRFYAPGGQAGTRKAAKGSDRGGLVFPGDEPPDYWDFLHFALIIGVASQTADIQIADKGLRRISTLHSVAAFLFNTVIVALTVNLAVGLLGDS